MNYRALWVLPVTFLLASCGPPTSIHPLGDLKTAPVDEVLLGQWECISPKKGDAEACPDIWFLRKEGGLWHLLMKDTKRDSWSKEPNPAFTTIIGCDRYLNLINRKDHYFFCKYSVSLDGTLMIALMKEQPVAKAIDGKQLQGKVERDAKGKLKSVLITDSTENIRAYIEKEDPKELFEFIGSFKKKAEQPKAEEQF